MKKVLYLTNIQVPYRVRFFNELAKYCDLTVLYERESSGNRNAQWAGSEVHRCRVKFLRGIPLAGENAFSLGILKELFGKYDSIIVGCYNSPVQMLAVLVMRLCRIPYIMNLDGEPFLQGRGLKAAVKRFFLSGAQKYLVAGECVAQAVAGIAKGREIIPYHFSSLSEEELLVNRSNPVSRNDAVLVVGQYFEYKGMDIALEAARLAPDLRFRLVGMGSRTELLLQEYTIPENVEIIPFLQKKDLVEEYRSCGMLVLPSRQECWGLVINEAASFGTPIVSTWGSGAAVEFLAEDYPQHLATPGDAGSLLECIRRLQLSCDRGYYSDFLMRKSSGFSIERSAWIHACALGTVDEEN